MKRGHGSKEIFYVEIPVAGWVDLFIRNSYLAKLTDSLKWCCEKKGMRLAEYVILPNRLILIAGTAWGTLPQTLSVFENFTSRAMMKMIRNGYKDPRKKWISETIMRYGTHLPDGTLSIWQPSDPTPIISNESAEERISNLYRQPVYSGFVLQPEHYRYSSANPSNPLKGWLIEATDRW